MEGLIVILVIVVLVFVYQLFDKIKKLNNKIDGLGAQMKHFMQEYSSAQKEVVAPKAVPKTEVKEEEVRIPAPIPVQSSPVPTPKLEVIEALVEKKQEEKKVVVKPAPIKPVKPKKPSFMERNPDLEKFIGENLLSKIGIAIFVIGMGFLVKLGIDNEVISEGMRVAIGVLIGGGLIGLAHYLRNSFSKFSSILIGGALAILYFTIALAMHEYQLIPQSAAFVIMVFITAFAVLLSIASNRKSLAVLALIGGFGTPFFVSTGEGNFAVLLSYILILDIGMLILVYFKKWNIVNYLAYGFTYLLFTGVFSVKFLGDEDSARFSIFLFLTAFYLIFFLMSIVYNIKNKLKFNFREVTMLLSNSAIYFGFGLAILHGFHNGLYSGVFTVLIALFNFGFAFTFYRRKDIDTNLLYLLIGLVLTFVTLVAPIQLKGNYITLFWAIESVLLLWLSQKSGIRLMRLASVLISLLMLVSLVMDWDNYYYYYEEESLTLLFNKLFIASLVAMLSLLASFLLAPKEEILSIKKFDFVWKPLYVQVMFGLVVYFGFYLEFNYQLIQYDFAEAHRYILLGIYNFVYISVVLLASRILQHTFVKKVSAVLSAIAVLSYMTFYVFYISEARDLYVTTNANGAAFYIHYVQLFLFVFILITLSRGVYQYNQFKSRLGTVYLCLLAFVGIYVGSAEMGHLSVLFQYSGGAEFGIDYSRAVKSVYPIVWAVSALLLMIVGMKYRVKTLRIASLVVFMITIIKLFAYDLAGNSTGKIVSFILLGVILLVISFLYQKLKFIIQDDEEK